MYTVWASHAPGMPIIPPLPTDVWDQVGWVDNHTLAQEIRRTLDQHVGVPFAARGSTWPA